MVLAARRCRHGGVDQLLRDAKDKAASTQELELNLFEFDEQTG